MFMEIDLGTPIKNTYVRNLKIKNTVLRYWPTKTITDENGNSIEVFGKLYMWIGYVPNDTASVELYKLLGTSVSELQKNNWDHVVSAWMYFKPYHLDRSSVTLSDQDVAIYINNNSTLDEEYEVKMQYSQEFSGNLIGSTNKITDKQIIDMIEGGYNSLYDPALIAPSDSELNRRIKASPVYSNSMITYKTDVNQCTFASIMDTNDLLFESTTSIVSKTIEEVHGVNDISGTGFGRTRANKNRLYTVKATISYKYKRVKDANDSSVSVLISDIKDKALSIKKDPFSFYFQVEQLLREYNPVLPGELAYSYSTKPIFGQALGTTENYIRKDAAAELKPADFTNMLVNSLDNDYEQESCHGWKCFIAIIVMVVAIVIAVYSAGALSGVSITAISTVAEAAAFFGALALTLSVATLAMGLMAQYLMKNGQYQTAISFGSSIVILGKLSELVGYVAIATAIGAIYENLRQEATKQAIQEYAREQGTEIAVDELTPQVVEAIADSGVVQAGFSDYIVAGFQMIKAGSASVFNNFSKAPGAAMNKIAGWLNTGMKIYTTYIDPIKQPTAGEPQGDTTPTTSIQDIAWKQSEFDDYTFLDMNARMDQTPEIMTQRGLMRETLSKYYEA